MVEIMKVLIASHNPINDIDNVGRTLKNIFYQYKREDICQLYLKNQAYDLEKGHSYFLLSDFNIFKSILFRKQVGLINPLINDSDKNNTKVSIRKNNYLMKIIREIVWKWGNPYSKKLKSWIKDENPDYVFYALSNYVFMNNLVLKICKKNNLPLITYIMDDYFFSSDGKFKFYKMKYDSSLKEIMEYSNSIFCISKKMCIDYSAFFKKESNVLMNTTNIQPIEKEKRYGQVINITYLGNLDFNRWKALILINEILIKCSSENYRFILNVYSSENNEKILIQLKNNKVNFLGSVSYKETLDIMKKSDFLLHTEYNDSNIEFTKYSMSTKIPDSLAIGTPLIAYGPSNIASIEYLKQNKCAIVLSNLNELENFIKNFPDEKLFSQIRTNAYNVVKRNHYFVDIKKKIESGVK